jgi:hypothetical protein
MDIDRFPSTNGGRGLAPMETQKPLDLYFSKEEL